MRNIYTREDARTTNKKCRFLVLLTSSTHKLSFLRISHREKGSFNWDKCCITPVIESRSERKKMPVMKSEIGAYLTFWRMHVEKTVQIQHLLSTSFGDMHATWYSHGLTGEKWLRVRGKSFKHVTSQFALFCAWWITVAETSADSLNLMDFQTWRASNQYPSPIKLQQQCFLWLKPLSSCAGWVKKLSFQAHKAQKHGLNQKHGQRGTREGWSCAPCMCCTAMAWINTISCFYVENEERLQP